MEIFIIGAVIVVLMAYVSTKIKKTSAAAYAPELLNAAEYSVVKPDGYIVPWNEESAFKALSKEMGKSKGAEKLYRSSAELRIFDDLSFDEVCRGARKSVKNVVSEESAREDDMRFCFMHGKALKDDTDMEVYYKIVENQATGKVFELQVSVLSEAMEDYGAKASGILQSFNVKRKESEASQEA